MKRINKKGQLSLIGLGHPLFNLFAFIVVVFVTVLFLAGLTYSMSLINGVLNDVGAANEVNAGNVGYTNMTAAAQNTFGKAYSAMDGLRLVSMAIIFSMIMGIILINLFVRVYPVLWIVYVFIAILAVILSVPVSNAYESIVDAGGPMVPFITEHAYANFILLNLPLFITFLGTIGSIFLFINIMRAGNEGPL